MSVPVGKVSFPPVLSVLEYLPSMKVSFFESGAGKFPVEEFIKEQNSATGGKISRLIDLLEEFGSNIRFPYSEKVNKRLFALRITGDIQVRIFYIFYKNSVVLLHAFKKKTPKISPKEIEIAQSRADSLTKTG